MRIRSYVPSDIDKINEWLVARDLAPVDPRDLPPRGWVVMDGKRPAGAVFLRMAEGNYGIMDSMINDPHEEAKKRHQINDRLFLQVMKFVRVNEIRGIIGTSLDKGTLERALRHGFLPSPQSLVVWRNEKVQ